MPPRARPLAVPALCALLGLAALLAGCSRPAGDTLFPLDPGRRWAYVITTTPDDGDAAPLTEQRVLIARGDENVVGAPAWRRRSDSGVDYWLRSDDSGVYRVASRGPLDAQPLPDDPPRYVLRKPFVVGTQWEASTTTYILARRNEFPRELRNLARYRAFPMKYRIEALGERVTTPAGSFEGCLRVHGTAEVKLYVDEAFAWRDVPLTTREWYCPGVGLARLERRETSPTKFIAGGSLTMELTSAH